LKWVVKEGVYTNTRSKMQSHNQGNVKQPSRR